MNDYVYMTMYNTMTMSATVYIIMILTMAIPRCLYQYEYIVSQDKSVAKVCT